MFLFAKINSKIELFINYWTKSNFKLWFLFFLYTLFTGLFIQLILLPYVFPLWHDNNGLMVSSFDSKVFHNQAIALAQKIKIDGWQAWQLFPKGYVITGLLSAIYAATNIYKPFVFLPISAFFHSMSAILLLLILENFLVDKKKVLIAILPFLLYPSAALWYSQLHKDGIFIFATYLILYSLLTMSKVVTCEVETFKLFKTFIYAVMGYFLIWLTRAYFIPYILLLTGIILFIFFSLALLKDEYLLIKLKKAIIILSYLCVLAITSNVCGLKTYNTWFQANESNNTEVNISSKPNTKSYNYHRIESIQTAKDIAIQERNEPRNTEVNISSKPNTKSYDYYRIGDIQIQPSKSMAIQKINELNNTKVNISSKPNTKSYDYHRIESIQTAKDITIQENVELKQNKLIFKLQRVVDSINSMRRGFITTPGKTNIDTNVSFGNLPDIIKYLPRAVIISFFSPFPYQWFEEGSLPENTIMRRISAFEMLVVYFAFIFLFYAIWSWRKLCVLWIFLLYNTSFLIIYSLVVCNIGTLYRMRYGFLMAFVGLGIVGFMQFLIDKKSINKIDVKL